MNKKSFKIIIVFVIAIVILLGITNNYHSGLSKSTRSLEKNNAEEILLKSGNTYKTGEDIKPGYYDVSYVESGNNEKIIFKAKSLSVGDRMLNIPLNRGDEVTLYVEDSNADGKGKLMLTPSSFEPLIEDDEGRITLSHSGYYVVGEDIAPGEYNAIISIDESELNYSDSDAAIRIFKDLSLRENLRNYSFRSVNMQKIVFFDSEVIYFNNSIDGLDYELKSNVTRAHGFECDTLKVVLTK